MRVSISSLIKGAVFTVILFVIGIFVTAVTYGFFPTVELIRLIIIGSIVISLPLALILNRVVRPKQWFLLFMLSVVILFLVTSFDNKAVADLACHSQNAVSIGQLDQNESPSDVEITFCGSLQKCTNVAVDTQGTQYEVCLISDIWDKNKVLQFYNYQITNADDPLVQVSAEQHLWGYLDKDTFVINSGFQGTSRGLPCVFADGCAGKSQTITTLFGDIYIRKTITATSK